MSADAGVVGVAVAPGPAPALVAAVEAGGGRVVGAAEAEALVWTEPADPDGLRALLAGAPGLRWIQLPFAGVDDYGDVLDLQRRWTSAKGAYSEPVAEHALALALAGFRVLASRARARSWGPQEGHRLMGAPVTVVGGGGITEALLRLLAPFGTDTWVVRRRPAAMAGAARVVGTGDLHEALARARLVVLALPLVPATRGLVGATELDVMGPEAWLVNVARGAHVVTADLVEALRQGRIGGAALDVTDPEPLPDGHPLWDLDNCLITPHVANTSAMAEPLLAERVRANVERWRHRRPLLGVVDPAVGY